MKRLLCCCMLIGCCLFLSVFAAAQVQKIYLNPKATGNIKQSRLIDAIRFVPLEIKEGIQPGEYNTIIITDRYFVITDYPGKVIMLYARDGRFIRKIGLKKLGETFNIPSYDEAADQLVFFGQNKNYSLTPRDLVKIMLDWKNPRNKKYFKKYTISLADTSFTLKAKSPDEADMLHAVPFDGNAYWQSNIAVSPLYKDSLDYEFKIYRNHQLVKGFFPYNRIEEPRFLYGSGESAATTPTNTPSVHFMTRPYCDTIYRLTGDSLHPAYHLVLPLENSLPPSFYTRPFKNKTERENFGRNNGWKLHQIYGFYETPELIFLTISYLSNFESYIYQKQSRAAYRTKNIKADSSQYNLQLLAGYGVQRKGDTFYRYQSAGDLLTFFEKVKGVPVPKELESFLQGNPPKTAPVIIEFKLKN